MDIITAHATKNLCYIAAQKMTPKGIVVHSTAANNPYLKRYVDCPEKLGTNIYHNHWNNATPGNRKVCVHAFIGYDKNKNIKVAEILPLDICCWGVGSGNKGSYNYDPAYIQFEICEDDRKDKNYYKKIFSVAAEYCAYLCKRFSLKVENIVSHKEAHALGYGCNHGDPEHWMVNFGETMDDFRNQVTKLLYGTESSVSEGNEAESESQNAIIKGSLVSISENAAYYNGVKIPAWVKKQNWIVKSVNGDRAVIDKNEKGTASICSAVSTKYLSVVAEDVSASVSSAFPYQVKVVVNAVNIRTGAGTNHSIIGCITDKGVYTIIAEKRDAKNILWGKLKNGGWIALDCTKKA